MKALLIILSLLLTQSITQKNPEIDQEYQLKLVFPVKAFSQNRNKSFITPNSEFMSENIKHTINFVQNKIIYFNIFGGHNKNYVLQNIYLISENFLYLCSENITCIYNRKNQEGRIYLKPSIKEGNYFIKIDYLIKTTQNQKKYKLFNITSNQSFYISNNQNSFSNEFPLKSIYISDINQKNYTKFYTTNNILFPKVIPAYKIEIEYTEARDPEKIEVNTSEPSYSYVNKSTTHLTLIYDFEFFISDSYEITLINWANGSESSTFYVKPFYIEKIAYQTLTLYDFDNFDVVYSDTISSSISYHLLLKSKYPSVPSLVYNLTANNYGKVKAEFQLPKEWGAIYEITTYISLETDISFDFIDEEYNELTISNIYNITIDNLTFYEPLKPMRFLYGSLTYGSMEIYLGQYIRTTSNFTFQYDGYNYLGWSIYYIGSQSPVKVTATISTYRNYNITMSQNDTDIYPIFYSLIIEPYKLELNNVEPSSFYIGNEEYINITISYSYTIEGLISKIKIKNDVNEKECSIIESGANYVIIQFPKNFYGTYDIYSYFTNSLMDFTAKEAIHSYIGLNYIKFQNITYEFNNKTELFIYSNISLDTIKQDIEIGFSNDIDSSITLDADYDYAYSMEISGSKILVTPGDNKGYKLNYVSFTITSLNNTLLNSSYNFIIFYFDLYSPKDNDFIYSVINLRYNELENEILNIIENIEIKNEEQSLLFPFNQCNSTECNIYIGEDSIKEGENQINFIYKIDNLINGPKVEVVKKLNLERISFDDNFLEFNNNYNNIYIPVTIKDQETFSNITIEYKNIFNIKRITVINLDYTDIKIKKESYYTYVQIFYSQKLSKDIITFSIMDNYFLTYQNFSIKPLYIESVEQKIENGEKYIYIKYSVSFNTEKYYPVKISMSNNQLDISLNEERDTVIANIESLDEGKYILQTIFDESIFNFIDEKYKEIFNYDLYLTQIKLDNIEYDIPSILETEIISLTYLQTNLNQIKLAFSSILQDTYSFEVICPNECSYSIKNGFLMINYNHILNEENYFIVYDKDMDNFYNFTINLLKVKSITPQIILLNDQEMDVKIEYSGELNKLMSIELIDDTYKFNNYFYDFNQDDREIFRIIKIQKGYEGKFIIHSIFNNSQLNFNATMTLNIDYEITLKNFIFDGKIYNVNKNDNGNEIVFIYDSPISQLNKKIQLEFNNTFIFERFIFNQIESFNYDISYYNSTIEILPKEIDSFKDRKITFIIQDTYSENNTNYYLKFFSLAITSPTNLEKRKSDNLQQFNINFISDSIFISFYNKLKLVPENGKFETLIYNRRLCGDSECIFDISDSTVDTEIEGTYNIILDFLNTVNEYNGPKINFFKEINYTSILINNNIYYDSINFDNMMLLYNKEIQNLKITIRNSIDDDRLNINIKKIEDYQLSYNHKEGITEILISNINSFKLEEKFYLIINDTYENEEAKIIKEFSINPLIIKPFPFKKIDTSLKNKPSFYIEVSNDLEQYLSMMILFSYTNSKILYLHKDKNITNKHIYRVEGDLDYLYGIYKINATFIDQYKELNFISDEELKIYKPLQIEDISLYNNVSKIKFEISEEIIFPSNKNIDKIVINFDQKITEDEGQIIFANRFLDNLEKTNEYSKTNYIIHYQDLINNDLEVNIYDEYTENNISFKIKELKIISIEPSIISLYEDPREIIVNYTTSTNELSRIYLVNDTHKKQFTIFKEEKSITITIYKKETISCGTYYLLSEFSNSILSFEDKKITFTNEPTLEINSISLDDIKYDKELINDIGFIKDHLISVIYVEFVNILKPKRIDVNINNEYSVDYIENTNVINIKKSNNEKIKFNDNLQFFIRDLFSLESGISFTISELKITKITQTNLDDNLEVLITYSLKLNKLKSIDIIKKDDNEVCRNFTDSTIKKINDYSYKIIIDLDNTCVGENYVKTYFEFSNLDFDNKNDKNNLINVPGYDYRKKAIKKNILIGVSVLGAVLILIIVLLIVRRIKKKRSEYIFRDINELDAYGDAFSAFDRY